MPDRPKASIPAWQRVQQPQEEKQVPVEKLQDVTSEDAPKAPEREDSSPDPTTSESISTDKSEAKEQQEASPSPSPATPPLISTDDFAAFRREQKQPKAPYTSPQPRTTSPPIITYPEFLVEAHKPPPFITLSRIWDTAYIASGITAFLYGASKYLVQPMSDSLNDARHDFAVHSLGKVGEFNERLSKLVSKMPENKKDTTLFDDMDTESEASDPAELYHRNIGTQTSPPSSRQNSLTEAAGKKVTLPTDYQENGLKILKDHLTDMLERSASLESENKKRQDKMSILIAYLDTMMYASPGISSWAVSEHVANGEGPKEDGVDELKKEIRAVKGLMLSAKRFPGVGGRVGGGS